MVSKMSLFRSDFRKCGSKLFKIFLEIFFNVTLYGVRPTVG